MRKILGRVLFPILAFALLAPMAALAQTGDTASAGDSGNAGKTARLTSSTDRLFLSFVEDAMVADRQWWEGQIQYLDGDPVDAALVSGVVAFQPWSRIELGGRVGFGSSDAPAGLNDGTGATDLDVWGKLYFRGADRPAEYAVGGIVTIPTGDDAVGLGADAFAIKGFGAVRYRFEKWVFAGHVGVQVNGDGSMFGSPDRDGKVSPSVSGAAIVPWSDRVTFVGEARIEGKRFEGGDNAAEALAGINWRVSNRGQVRVAFGLGLQDGSPDARLIGGYAASF